MAQRGRKRKSANALELLKADHDELKRKYEDFKSETEYDRRADLGSDILQMLDVHTTIEEEIFYPAAEAIGGDLVKTLVAKALAEHKSARNLLDELKVIDVKDEEYDLKMEALMSDVAAHIEEEEEDLFPEIKDNLNLKELERLGGEMMERKDELGESPLEEAAETIIDE